MAIDFSYFFPSKVVDRIILEKISFFDSLKKFSFKSLLFIVSLCFIIGVSSFFSGSGVADIFNFLVRIAFFLLVSLVFLSAIFFFPSIFKVPLVNLFGKISVDDEKRYSAPLLRLVEKTVFYLLALEAIFFALNYLNFIYLFSYFGGYSEPFSSIEFLLRNLTVFFPILAWFYFQLCDYALFKKTFKLDFNAIFLSLFSIALSIVLLFILLVTWVVLFFLVFLPN